MANFGQLDEFFSEHDVEFQLGGKNYEITVAADKVLDFNKFWHETHTKDNAKTGAKAGERVNQANPQNIWATTARLLGGDFNEKTNRFEGGIAEELINAGVPMTKLDVLLSSIWAKFYYDNDELAEEYLKTGHLGKALSNLGKRNEQEQNTEQKN